MNSDAEYPLEFSKEKYVMLRRSVFDAMQTRIAELMELLKSARAAMNGLDHNTDDIQLMNDIDAATAETQDANCLRSTK